VGLFDLFKNKAKVEVPEEVEETQEQEGIEVYSGIRVEVTTFEDQLLFTAKLMDLKGDTGELYQYFETGTLQSGGPVEVKIRGYSAYKRKAVYMEGVITPEIKNMWRVEDLVITKVENDRAFFRLNVDVDAVLTRYDGPDAAEAVCRLLNISIGGACIFTQEEYSMGSKFRLRVRLLGDRPEFLLYCEILRIIEKDETGYEYGCRFLEISEEEEQRIIQSMFAIQSMRKDIC